MLALVRLLVMLLFARAGAIAAEPGISLGLGRTVSDAEIKAWDIDVRPDGEGLPAGSGSVAEGERVYAQKCLMCHGERGANGINDQLVGRIRNDAFPFALDPSAKKTIGSYWPYATTVFDYVRRAMPYDRPGSLSDNEVYSVTAYLLHLNGIIDREVSVDAASLPKIRMPARHRFVADDRTTSEQFTDGEQ